MRKLNSFNKWLVSLTLLLTAVLSATPFVDQQAAADHEQLFQRAFITFALARTINGVISAVQGTEIALQPAGVGITLTPGEILDPVNDLVERFSWIMLGATISLGVQNVLLDISAWWVIQTLVVLMTLWMLMRVWYPGRDNRVLKVLLTRVFLVVLFVRFAVPAMLIANDFLYQQFLEPHYVQSTQIVTKASQELKQLNPDATVDAPGTSEGGLLDSIAKAWSSTVDTLDLPEKLEYMQARASQVTEHVVQLSVVFILQTGLLPVAFLWFFFRVIKSLFRPVSYRYIRENDETVEKTDR